MYRMLFILLAFFSQWASAASTETQSLLDNRFRIDPTIKQVAFIIYRDKPSNPAILIRPDGTKYYSWQHPKNVDWYEADGMDIVSIENPMPGPWQAIGRITPKNNIKILSNLALHTDAFPKRLYKDESIKFTSRLSQKDRSIVLRDFLNSVTLEVGFIPYVEGMEKLPAEALPKMIVVGRFFDDGKRLDEVPGDGIFTVNMPISVNPGKYKVRISSGNGVFLRAVEQTVLVYPRPFDLNFEPAKDDATPHKLLISAAEGLIEPGSTTLHIKSTAPDDTVTTLQATTEKDQINTELVIPNDTLPGSHAWEGILHTTETSEQRHLVFNLPEVKYNLLDHKKMKELAKRVLEQEAQKHLEEEKKRIEEERYQAKIRAISMIVGGNLILGLLAFIGWFAYRKFKGRKKDTGEEFSISMPPPPSA